MKLRNWVALGAASLGIGLGLRYSGLLPLRLDTTEWHEWPQDTHDRSAWPNIEVSILRCGDISIPELIATRGALSLAPRTIAHSAILIRHPRATFLYDTGLSSDIALYLRDQPLFFRKTLANFEFERSLRSHLDERGIQPGPAGLDFVLVSHLHWDHVSGVPDIPGVPLRINRVEYDAALPSMERREGVYGLVRDLMGDNSIELFGCDGPPYEGFRASHDLFGDGSIVLVPLPGHTPGNTGMFINRANGSRVFLLGDAVWVSENYLRPAPMHPFIWSRVTSDNATALQTLIDLHHFAKSHPEMPMIAMHDAQLQDSFMQVERAQALQVSR